MTIFRHNSTWLHLYLKVRFRRPVMWIEHTVVSALGWLYMNGNIVDYTKVRNDAYHLWLNGYDAAKALNLPRFLTNNWIAIWELYLLVLGDQNENKNSD